MKPERFWATHTVFTREEFATALARRGSGAFARDVELTSHPVATARVVQVKRGLYVRQDTDAEADVVARRLTDRALSPEFS